MYIFNSFISKTLIFKFIHLNKTLIFFLLNISLKFLTSRCIDLKIQVTRMNSLIGTYFFLLFLLVQISKVECNICAIEKAKRIIIGSKLDV